MRFVLLSCLGWALAVDFAPEPAHAAGSATFPRTINLPNGFFPEGIAISNVGFIYTGSLVDGAIYRTDVYTGTGDVLVPGRESQVSAGLATRGRQLFVAGGPAGNARVFDNVTGELIADIPLAGPNGFVNDVIVTFEAAYFTNSFEPVLYRIPRQAGVLGVPEALPLTGDLVYQQGFNANGIEALPDGHTLLVIQSNTGKLFEVNGRTGETRAIAVEGGTLTSGDGLLRQGSILYVVRNRLNLLTRVRLDPTLQAAQIERETTSPRFDVPTTVAAFGPRLYLVNARFGTEPTPQTAYTIEAIGGR